MPGRGTKVVEQDCEPSRNAVFLQRVARRAVRCHQEWAKRLIFGEKHVTLFALDGIGIAQPLLYDPFDSLRTSLQKGINRLNSEAAFVLANFE